MAETTTPPQAENAAPGNTTASRAISTLGPDGNVAGNDASNLPMDFDEVDALLYGGATANVGADSVEGGGSADAAPVTQPVVPAVGAPTPPQESTVPVTQEPVTTTTTPAAEVVPTIPEATGPAAGERIIPGRISTGQFSETEQRAMSLMHTLNGGKPSGVGPYTLSQCLAMVENVDAGKTTTGETIPAPESAPAVPSAMDTLRAEVEELEAQILDAGEERSLFTPEFARKTIDLTTKKAQLATLEASERNRQEAEIHDIRAQRAAVKKAVVAEFKDAEDTKTFLGARVAALAEELKDPNHPDHERLYKADAPRFVVETAAKEVAQSLASQMGIPVEEAYQRLRSLPAPASVTTPQEPLPVAGNRTVTVATGSQGTGGTPTPMTEQQIIAALTADPDQMDNALGYTGTLRM